MSIIMELLMRHYAHYAKLNHEDEEGVEGRYETGSYYIKCEQREIEITA